MALLRDPRLRGSCQALPSGFLSAHEMGHGARSLGRWAPIPAGSPETDPLLQLLIHPLTLARLPGKLGKLLCSPNLDMRHRYAQVSFLALGSALTPDSARGALCGAGEEARSTTRTACAFSAVLSLCPHTIPWDEPNVGTRIRNPNCSQCLLQNFPPFFHRVLVTGGQLGDRACGRRAGRPHCGIHRPAVLPVAPNTPSNGLER